MRVSVEYLGGDRLAVTIRDHLLVVDQPVVGGGADQGPTPVELFVASLAACVGFYAERFLRRHGLTADALRVDATATMSEDRPARVATIDVRLDGLDDLPPGRRAALLAVIEHCTVHNSLRLAPEVRLVLAAPATGTGHAAGA